MACGNGDLDGLLGLLADDVVVWTDGGGKVRAALRPVVGAHRSSRFLLNVAKKAHGFPREVMLNGQPALVFLDGACVTAALILDSSEAKIVAVRVGVESGQAGAPEPGARARGGLPGRRGGLERRGGLRAR